MHPIQPEQAARAGPNLAGSQEDQGAKPSDKDEARLGKQVRLKEIYYGSSSGAFRGPLALFKQARAQGHADISLKDVKRFLSSQPVYTLYRPARRNYSRNRIEANEPGQVLQVDIMDMQRFAHANNGLKYVLLGYDTYSKYSSAFALKDRTPPSVIKGLAYFIQTLPFSIKQIYWDKEGSFLSRQVQHFLKSKKIGNYTTTGKIKAPGVERLIRTIRMYMQRYFEYSGNSRWIDRLGTFIDTYNERKHSTTKRKPVDLATDPLLQPAKTPSRHAAQNVPPVGSYVRLNRLRGLFDKEASGSWTQEIFKVVAHNHKDQRYPMLVLQDLVGEQIRGSLYAPEVQAIAWDGTKTVKNVLERRERQGEARTARRPGLGRPHAGSRGQHDDVPSRFGCRRCRSRGRRRRYS